MNLLWFALFALTGVAWADPFNDPTKSDVPNGKLVTYEILHEDPRTVQFYWPAQAAQTTTVEVRSSNGFLTKQLLESNRTSFTVENQDSDSRLEFHIFQKIGAQTVQQTMHVPVREQLLPDVKRFLVKRDSFYKMAWDPLNHPEPALVNYTIVWCIRTEASDECIDGEFGYHSTKDTSFIFKSDKNLEKYRFGVISSTDRSSSGIHWARCIRNDDSVAKLTSISGEPINATSIRIHLNFYCPGTSNLVYQYKVTYSPVNQPEVKPVTKIILDKRGSEELEIANLALETEYKIRVDGIGIEMGQETIATTDMEVLCVKVPKSSKTTKLT